MHRIKYESLIVAIMLSLAPQLAATAQNLTDAYAFAETRSDIPSDWQAWPQTNNNTRNDTASVSDHWWMGRRQNQAERPSIKNKILVASRIFVVVCHSPAGAQANIAARIKMCQVSPVPGAYTSKPLGDVCYRTSQPSYDGTLWFSRANVFFMVTVYGPPGEIDYPKVAERIARTMLARTDAAISLAKAGAPDVGSSSGPVGTKLVGKVSVVLVDEWAKANGASWKPDWQAGTVTVQRGAHTLRLNVGSKEAVIDGARTTLAFPALRRGKDQIWCPESVLQKL